MDMVNVVLDMKGLSCPRPLIGAKRMVDELSPGQILLLVSDCPGTPDDLFAWAKLTGNQILKTEKMPDGGTGYHIQKGQSGVQLPHAHVTLDIRGAVCPGPIVEAKKLLNGMQTGEVLRLVSDCPGVQSDIGGWASATGMTLLNTVEAGAGVHEFYIRKG
ncbi:MAG: sulfurtransferase TusA family protein [Gammaproteobacteria bacterium]|nr:sulfurtransferase TusA family protein [Gammaproteobacteria bacterium]MBU1969942.1 sulfurtransferase TusA family protein [Gammaproteobacteria bacterium]